MNRRLRTSSAARAQRGAALIEVLVAMLIFMFGILGYIGLQTTMTRAQTESKMRADAIYLAGEAVGQMWSDLNSLSAYNGTGCATQAHCSVWQGKVAQVLPGGLGAVAVDANGNVTVTVTWSVPGGETHKYELQTTVVKASS